MRARILILGVMFAVFFFASLSYSGVPQMINYQGKLTDPQGALIDTTVAMVFSIYVDESGMTAPLWNETQDSVKVEKGIFSVLLGSVNSIPDSVFTGAVRYLGVQVEDDSEMRPLKPMVSVGYAFKSEFADTAEYALVGRAIEWASVTGSGLQSLNILCPSSGILLITAKSEHHMGDGSWGTYYLKVDGATVDTGEEGTVKYHHRCAIPYNAVTPVSAGNHTVSITGGGLQNVRSSISVLFFSL